jgi:hypothetical protein
MRAGIVAEGKTDVFILEAVLKRMRPDVVVDRIQPEYHDFSREFGDGGWGRVKKWCRDEGTDLFAYMNLIYPRLDLLVIHADADIADDLGLAGPCRRPSKYAAAVSRQVRAWCTPPIPKNVIFAVPCLRIETWIYAALAKRSLANLECNPDVDDYLARRGLQSRGRHRKHTHKYRQAARRVAANFDRVAARCGEARRFQNQLKKILSTKDG